MSDNHVKHDAPNVSSARYMNAYERAYAHERMEQAMALADWSIRVGDRVRAALKRAGNALRRTLVQDRQRGDDAVSYRGLP